jgi:hypothetical protein
MVLTPLFSRSALAREFTRMRRARKADIGLAIRQHH